MKSAISQITLGMIKPETFLHAVGKAKFDGVEFNNFGRPNFIEECLKEKRVKTLRSIAEEYGLRVLSVNALDNFSPTSQDEFRQVIKDFERMVEFCVEIGGEIVVVCPSFLKSGLKQEVIIDKVSKALKKLAKHSKNIDIGFEFLGFKECSVNNLEMAIEVVKKTENDRVGLVLDTFHYFISGSSIESIKQMPIEKLLLVHFDDAEALPKE